MKKTYKTDDNGAVINRVWELEEWYEKTAYVLGVIVAIVWAFALVIEIFA